MARKKTARLVLIDGHSLLHRAYHAFPKDLATSEGQLVNAAYGFARIFLAVIKELGPDYLVVVFDRPEPTFRHKFFADYKIQRPPTPEDLVSQIGLVKEIVRSFGVPIFEKKGFEADDVIGTLAYRVTERSGERKDKNFEVVIVTSDRDMLQLVLGKQIRVYFPQHRYSKAQFLDESGVRKNYRLSPAQLVDLKALTGDPSDNIPGVSGIGPKTSIILLQEFGSLEGIYENLEAVEAKIVRKLRKEKKAALLSKRLAKIDTEVVLDLDLRKCRFGNFEKEVVKALFQRLEFKSLLGQLPGDGEQMRLV